MSATRTRSETVEEIEEPVNPDAEPEEEIEPDDGEEEGSEETPEEPSEPSSLTQVEAMSKAMDAEERRHRKAVEKIMGDDFGDFQECPLCQVSGYAMQWPLGSVAPEQRAAIAHLLSEDSPPRYKPHPKLRRCELCDGQGKLDTGSRNPGFEQVGCDQCGGNGYVDPAVVQLVQRPVTPTQYPWDEQPAAPQYPGPNVDQYGRPAGHPHWGLDPAAVGV